ncbi:MAG: SpoIID/LytB domain-containing protein [Oscillospiraceae bacterium]|nr:SpoIID/LytB domain-containing protein [Oscillospiraceae bacterium]
MKRRVRFFPLALALALAFALLVFASPPATPALAATDPNPTLRIGLAYDSAALPAASLQNYSGRGSGYRLGYLDASRQFVELGRLEAQKITMLKNRNMYLKNGEYTETNSTGAVTVGCFHIDTNVTYSTFAAAKSRADTLRGNGLKAFPVYSGGTYRVRIGAYASSSAAAAAIPATGLSGATALSGSAYCVSVVTTDNGDIVFQFDGGESRWLAVWPSRGEASDPVTWFKGNSYRGGFEYRRMTGNNMTVTNWVKLQDYLKGVVPYEMINSWHIEALKAQALCAKSFALTNLNKHRSSGFELCNTTNCQVYRGLGWANANTDRAVDETYGLFVYYNNAVAQTVYHDSDGGSTESARNVWGSEIPYLQAVTDIYETHNSAWKTTFTNNDVAQILKEKGVSIGTVAGVYVDAFTPAGNVYRLVIVDTLGKRYVYEGSNARTILNSPSRGLYVRSQRFTVTGGGSGSSGGGAGSQTLYVASASGTSSVSSASGLYAITGKGTAVLDVPLGDLWMISKNGVSALPAATGTPPPSTPGVYVFSGTGNGHNVGMSQYGARAMADRGFKAADIINFYYTGVRIGN